MLSQCIIFFSYFFTELDIVGTESVDRSIDASLNRNYHNHQSTNRPKPRHSRQTHQTLITHNSQHTNKSVEQIMAGKRKDAPMLVVDDDSTLTDQERQRTSPVDATLCKKIRSRITTVLKDEFDLTTNGFNMKFDTTENQLKIQAIDLYRINTTNNQGGGSISNDKDSGGDDLAKSVWDVHCTDYGFSPCHYGKKFGDRDQFTISGIRPKNTKYPIFYTQVNESTGLKKSYKASKLWVKQQMRPSTPPTQSLGDHPPFISHLSVEVTSSESSAFHQLFTAHPSKNEHIYFVKLDRQSSTPKHVISMYLGTNCDVYWALQQKYPVFTGEAAAARDSPIDSWCVGHTDETKIMSKIHQLMSQGYRVVTVYDSNGEYQYDKFPSMGHWGECKTVIWDLKERDLDYSEE